MKIIIRLYAIGVFCQGTLADQQPTNANQPRGFLRRLNLFVGQISSL